MTRIVVGIDDSAGGRTALAWALEEARLRKAELEVAHVVTLPWTEGFNTEWPEDEAAMKQEAKKLVEAMIAEATDAEAAHAEGNVKAAAVVVRAEGPAFGLLEQSADADLLVVGSRGMGGFKGLLLGSVSAQCVRHARCPVVVVPATADR